MKAAGVQDGADVLLTLDPDDVITLLNVDLSGLRADDFSFA